MDHCSNVFLVSTVFQSGEFRSSSHSLQRRISPREPLSEETKGVEGSTVTVAAREASICLRKPMFEVLNLGHTTNGMVQRYNNNILIFEDRTEIRELIILSL